MPNAILKVWRISMSIFLNKLRLKTYMTAGFICVIAVVLASTYFVCDVHRGLSLFEGYGAEVCGVIRRQN